MADRRQMRLVFAGVERPWALRTASSVLLVLFGVSAASTPWLLRAQTSTPGTVAPATSTPGPAQPSQARVDGRGAPAGVGVIRGRVVAAATGAPLPRAQVTIRGADLLLRRVVSTDTQGRYVFDDVRPGRYRVAAEKVGFVSLSYGQRKPGDSVREVEVTASQAAPTIDLLLPTGSVIVVRISNEFGDPLPGLTADVHQLRYANGRRELVAVGGVMSAVKVTDDRGEVRLFGLAPGEYYVSAGMGLIATLRETGGSTYPRTYYPGVTDVAHAQRVGVVLGQEAQVGFQMTPARGARVTGIVRRSDGTPSARARLHVLGLQTIAADAAGRFTIPMVWPGQYVIETADDALVRIQGDVAAKPSDPNRASTRECAILPFTVAGEDINELQVITKKCGSMSGRFVLDTGQRPNGAQLLTTLRYGDNASREPDMTAGQLMVSADWTFWINGLMGERTFRLVGPTSGVAIGMRGQPVSPPNASQWYLKAAMLNGRDITDTPIDFSNGREVRDVEVILTRQQTEVSGTAVDSRNLPASDYVVVLFPEDRNRRTPDSRFIAAARSNQDGRFSIVGLPPGDYLAAAISDLEPTQERDPEFLDRLERVATRMMLGEGESRTLGLKLVAY